MTEVELLSRALEIAAAEKILWCSECRIDGQSTPAEFEVSWSDRCMDVCKVHLDRARFCAARDSSSDRTDNPRIRSISQITISEIVQDWRKKASKS